MTGYGSYLIFLLCIIIILNLQLAILTPTTRDNAGAAAVYKLSQLNVNSREITLSGFSAGASMTTQLHIAHSSLFSGAAIFSQAFYRCGPNSLIEFGIRCSKSGYEIIPYNVQNAIEDAKKYEREGLVDPLTSLRSQKVFIWTGSLDEYIPERMAVQNADLYTQFIPSEQVSVQVEKRAKHLFPTDNFGAACDQNAEHNYYLGNCNYSGAHLALRYMLGDSIIQPAVRYFNPSQLKVFDQSEFHQENITKAAMGTQGLIYIPKSCENSEKCYLHLHFHGCNEWPLDLATNSTLNNGFLPLAEANKIIVVFPLTTSIPGNMNGCWDFFSYTGKHFATRQGEQIKLLYGMIQRILGRDREDLLVTRK